MIPIRDYAFDLYPIKSGDSCARIAISLDFLLSSDTIILDLTLIYLHRQLTRIQYTYKNPNIRILGAMYSYKNLGRSNIGKRIFSCKKGRYFYFRLKF